MENIPVQSSLLPEVDATNLEPLHFLECHFLANCEAIETWFANEWLKTPAPVYGSVDLRNAGFKIAPVDMNLFPAGFNNLNPAYLSLSIEGARAAISRVADHAKRVLVIPESHTRNPFYWESIHTLDGILQGAGYDVRFGSLSEAVSQPTEIQLASGAVIPLQPLYREMNEFRLDGFAPDVVLLNNDLSDGIPDILQNLKYPVIPPAELGWSQRLKSDHFQYYAEVTAEFTDAMKMDPWLVAPLFRHCGQIDFMRQEGMECLIANAEILFAAIQKKYAEYNISYQPFLIVKADAGTYGMAVMTVRSVDELRSLNRKQRTKMSTIKGGQPVDRVIIQEGVYTFEKMGEDRAVAEPVVYLWGSSVVGGFYRVHQGRGIDESLNAPGMKFEPLSFAEPCNKPCAELAPDACQNRFYTYGVVARLSMLAAAREMQEQQKR